MHILDPNHSLTLLAEKIKSLDPGEATPLLDFYLTQALYTRDHEALLILAFAWAAAEEFIVTERVGQDFLALVEYSAYRGRLDS